MFWKLFGSSEKLQQALSQSGRAQDLSPTAAMPLNDDTPPLDENGQPRRLWLEGWSEKDEARVRGTDGLYLA